MTADDARKLMTAELPRPALPINPSSWGGFIGSAFGLWAAGGLWAKPPRPEIVKAVRECWNRAIERAAKNGRRVVLSVDVDRLRTPVHAAEWVAIYESLRADGFSVTAVPGAGTTQVSW